MRSIILFLTLGIGTAVIAFFVQAITFRFVPLEFGAVSFLFLACTEELPRFVFAFLAQKRNLIPPKLLTPSVFYGLGFVLVEAFLAQGNPLLANTPAIWIAAIASVHILLACIALYSARKISFRALALGFSAAILLHWGYNMLVLLFAQTQ